MLDLLRTLRKDNTGYDLKQLFIGAEGTLGVVTKVALLAPRLPTVTDVTFVAVPSFAAACAALRRAKQDLAEILSAFEFLDRASLNLAGLDGSKTTTSFVHYASPCFWGEVKPCDTEVTEIED